jgi:hypothetical protein
VPAIALVERMRRDGPVVTRPAGDHRRSEPGRAGAGVIAAAAGGRSRRAKGLPSRPCWNGAAARWTPCCPSALEELEAANERATEREAKAQAMSRSIHRRAGQGGTRACVPASPRAREKARHRALALQGRGRDGSARAGRPAHDRPAAPAQPQAAGQEDQTAPPPPRPSWEQWFDEHCRWRLRTAQDDYDDA